MVLDAVEAARTERPGTGRAHRIEHCGFPTGDSLMDEFGDFGARFYPYGEFERAGRPVVVSSDGPVTVPGPLEAAWAAMTRETIAGAVCGAADLGTSRLTAVRGITSTPARLVGRATAWGHPSGRQGRPGPARRRSVTVELPQLPEVGVTQTWVGGVLGQTS